MSRHILATIAIGLFAASCIGQTTSSDGLNLSPRDLSSPREISAEIAGLPVVWRPGGSGGSGSGPVYLDGRPGPTVRAPEHATEIAMSLSRRYYAYATSLLPGGDIGIMDSSTGETRILVNGSDRFPGAGLSFPSFADEERSVVFEVVGDDRIDLGVVDISTGKVQFLDLGGGFNQQPIASPDGRFYLVVCEREGGVGFSLCLVNRDTRTRNQLVEDQVFWNGAFTPSGTLVVFVGVSGGVLGEGSVHVVQVDGNNNRTLVTGLGSGAVVLGATSQDAVYTCRDPERPACSSVCAIGLDGEDPRRLSYLGERCVESGSDASP